ncbi:MAG: GntR family transcriptional regulator [Proteobacteria bacterium]|nr:GntR family transcriptional regulator [Pseudomonadota bacterium]
MMRNEAYDRFKDRLFQREFAPGQFLSQRELTVTLDMPIASIRDAVRMLEQEALIKVIPQRGIQITDVNVELIRNAFGLRMIIEAAAVRHFIRFGSARIVEHIERETLRILRASEGEITEALLDEALRVDELLHVSLVDSLDNKLVSETHRRNQDKIRLIRLQGRFTAERIGPAMEEHLAIIRAIRSGDADAAVGSLEKHLMTARARGLGLDEGA